MTSPSSNKPMDLEQFAGHTAGPWHAFNEWASDEAGLSVIALRGEGMLDTPTRGQVAWIGEFGASMHTEAVAIANARLIAAAPDLLAEVQRLRAYPSLPTREELSDAIWHTIKDEGDPDQMAYSETCDKAADAVLLLISQKKEGQ